MKAIAFSLLLATPLAASPFVRGLEAKAAGDLPRAARELAAAVSAEPRNAEAWMHYGTVLGWQERFDEARAALERGLAVAPRDYDLRLAHARVLAWQGDHDTAERALAALAAEFPDSEEVKVMQGRVAGWQGRRAVAERHYREVLAANPRQIDALTGMGDLARDRRQTAAARDFYQQALAIDPSPDVRERLENLDQLRLMRWDGGFTFSTFDGSGRSDWWSVWTQLSRQTAAGTIWGRVEQGERFDRQDTLLEIGLERPLGDQASVRVFGGGAPDADWAARWFAEGNLRWQPQAEHWPTLALDLRHSDFVPRGVTNLRTGFDYDFARGWRAGLRWLHQEFEGGDPTDGWIATLERDHGNGWWWRVGAARGAESLTGQTVAGGVLVSQLWFAGVRGPLGEDWGWRADYEFEDVKGGVDRHGISAGVFHSF